MNGKAMVAGPATVIVDIKHGASVFRFMPQHSGDPRTHPVRCFKRADFVKCRLSDWLNDQPRPDGAGPFELVKNGHLMPALREHGRSRKTANPRTNDSNIQPWSLQSSRPAKTICGLTCQGAQRNRLPARALFIIKPIFIVVFQPGLQFGKGGVNLGVRQQCLCIGRQIIDRPGILRRPES